MVGLTGNFGSGKSTVAGLFKKWGARVLDADRLAHEVFRKGNPIHRKIVSLFPGVKESFNRAKVGQIVFRDPARRQALESLVHPYVFERIQKELKQMRGGVTVVEVPLLFETGFDKHCDATVVVRTPREKVIRRLVTRGFRKAEAKRRWRAQMPLREQAKRADYLIDNSGERGKTEGQVRKIWEEIQKSFRQS